MSGGTAPVIRSQPLSVQPGMLEAMEDAIKNGAETAEATWLAYLASWMQSLANLQLGDILGRSVPVEHYENWILSFASSAGGSTTTKASTGVFRQTHQQATTGPRNSSAITIPGGKANMAKG